MASKRVYDYSSIVLNENDIDDPRVHINLANLQIYDRDHLITWLKFRGDSLKRINTMKELRSRVLEYFKTNTAQNLVDPTFGQTYKKAKVDNLGILQYGELPTIPILRQSLNPPPEILDNEMANPTSFAGWWKDLSNLRMLTIEHIEKYYQTINDSYGKDNQGQEDL